MKSQSLVINDICLYLKVFETGSDSSHITGKTLLTSSLIPITIEAVPQMLRPADTGAV